MRMSLAMIVRDEAPTIARVLADAATCCDELVVLDTGSTDATCQLAAQAGARVQEFAWCDDFAAARNAAFAACTGDWILWLDADDRLPPVVQQRLLAAKHGMLLRTDIDAVMVPYHYQISDAGGRCTYSFLRERLLRRRAGLRWHGVVHEVIAIPAGRSIIAEDLWVEHRPDPARRALNADRNLRILQHSIDTGDRSARTLFYYGNELRDHQRYAEAAGVYREYLQVSTLAWERYTALLHLSVCCRAQGETNAELMHLLDAVGADSSRAEAFVRAGVYFYDRQQWAQAVPLFVAATACGRPADGFVNEPDYTYLPWDYLVVCYSQLGQREAALQASVRALPDNPDADRVRANIEITRKLPT